MARIGLKHGNFDFFIADENPHCLPVQLPSLHLVSKRMAGSLVAIVVEWFLHPTHVASQDLYLASTGSAPSSDALDGMAVHVRSSAALPYL